MFEVSGLRAWRFHKGNLALLLLVGACWPGGAAQASTIGLTAANPAYSAKQIQMNDPLALDGTYWLDPDGGDHSNAFQALADMNTAGGGWTLGLQSLQGNPVSTTDMISNTGIVSATTSFTRDMTELAINQDAQIRHRLVEGGVVLFDGYYTGNYHGTLGIESAWTVIAGNLNVLSYHFGKDWSTSTNDVDDYSGNCAAFNDGNPWYYGSCTVAMPYWVGTGEPYLNTAPGLQLDSYQIYVRELSTPSLDTVPVPAALPLLASSFGILGLLGWRRSAKSA